MSRWFVDPVYVNLAWHIFPYFHLRGGSEDYSGIRNSLHTLGVQIILKPNCKTPLLTARRILPLANRF